MLSKREESGLQKSLTSIYVLLILYGSWCNKTCAAICAPICFWKVTKALYNEVHQSAMTPPLSKAPKTHLFNGG